MNCHETMNQVAEAAAQDRVMSMAMFIDYLAYNPDILRIVFQKFIAEGITIDEIRTHLGIDKVAKTPDYIF